MPNSPQSGRVFWLSDNHLFGCAFALRRFLALFCRSSFERLPPPPQTLHPPPPIPSCRICRRRGFCYRRAGPRRTGQIVPGIVLGGAVNAVSKLGWYERGGGRRSGPASRAEPIRSEPTLLSSSAFSSRTQCNYRRNGGGSAASMLISTR